MVPKKLVASITQKKARENAISSFPLAREAWSFSTALMSWSRGLKIVMVVGAE